LEHTHRNFTLEIVAPHCSFLLHELVSLIADSDDLVPRNLVVRPPFRFPPINSPELLSPFKLTEISAPKPRHTSAGSSACRDDLLSCRLTPIQPRIHNPLSLAQWLETNSHNLINAQKFDSQPKSQNECNHTQQTNQTHSTAPNLHNFDFYCKDTITRTKITALNLHLFMHGCSVLGEREKNGREK
jgi:hypothetical protein